MRVILILSLLSIAMATARAEDPAASAPVSRPAIATGTAQPAASPSALAAISASTQGTIPPQTALPQPIVAPATPSVSLPTTSGSQATDAATTPTAPKRAAASEPGHHKRTSMEEHFALANAAHDGHLTLDEAKAGYRSLVRHFSDIDATHKGYVTIEDIRTWRAQQRATRNVPRSKDGSLHPRPAYEPGMSTDRRSFNTSAAQTVGKTPDASTGAAATPAAQ